MSSFWGYFYFWEVFYLFGYVELSHVLLLLIIFNLVHTKVPNLKLLGYFHFRGSIHQHSNIESNVYSVLNRNVLYCIVLYYIVLYCIVLYCNAFYFIVFYCIVLHFIILNYIVLRCIVLHCIVLYCILLYFIVLYCIALYYIVFYCIALYCIVLRCHQARVQGWKPSSGKQ